MPILYLEEGKYWGSRVARQSELFFIWSMVNKQVVNSGMFMMQHFHKVANVGKGDIVFGGLITPLADILGYD